VDAQPLGDYGNAARSGDVILKPGGPWGPAVIALLRHLEDRGFTGAPRVVGDGWSADGRLAVTYVPGSSPQPHAWPLAAVGEVGVLLRGLHDATRDFVPPAGAAWKPWWMHELAGDHPVIGHCDLGPWNIIGVGGVPQAFIDWEFAGPVDPLWELAEAVWLNAQLHDDDIALRAGLPDAATRARMARAIVDGYELPYADRDEFCDRLIAVAAHSARAEAVTYAVTPDSADAVTADGYPILWAITWRARSASWIARHRRLLQRALTQAA
jgi:Ser/Thr protein kinase RdoA (MazF antagonist)